MKHVIILEDLEPNARQIAERLELSGGIPADRIDIVYYKENGVLLTPAQVARLVEAARIRRAEASGENVGSILVTDLAHETGANLQQMSYGFEVIREVAALHFPPPLPTGLVCSVQALLGSGDFKVLFMTAESQVEVLDHNKALGCPAQAIRLEKLQRPAQVHRFIQPPTDEIPLVERGKYRERLVELVAAWW